jgi:ABC-2 type transport system ATP-binding protein
MNVIETINLSKKYGTKTVVNNVNLHVKKGEIFGFLGRNGAGKSTFINMITGIVKPSSGNSKLLNEISLKSIHPRIGVLPDYSSFYDSLTALGHLKYYASINRYKLSTQEGKAVLARLGLLEHANKKVGKFSFGMKKKLGIAQAIVHDPELIFLDEPTSGVDAESSISIRQLIIELQQKGKTIFMTSHNLDEVEKICNRLAIMKDGAIIHAGTLEEIRAHYSSFIQIEMKHTPLPNHLQPTIHEFLGGIGKDIQTNENKTTLSVEKEANIPLIVKEFTKNEIDIYKLHVHAPSLENIFLDEHFKA